MTAHRDPSTPVTPMTAALDFDLEHELEAHRRELTGYCYRMLGSGSEAEDAVQETLVRAWKAIDRFEGRSSVRSWLYRIANNVCIDMLRGPQRRARPMDLGPSSTVETARAHAPGRRTRSCSRSPTSASSTIDGDPADVAAARESIRLAFVAALQHLPARQRAVLILCEVLKWQATEVAELLDTSVASVNSALQRARATLADLEVDAARLHRRPRARGAPGPLRRRLRALRHDRAGQAAARRRRHLDAAARPVAAGPRRTSPVGWSAPASGARARS